MPDYVCMLIHDMMFMFLCIKKDKSTSYKKVYICLDDALMDMVRILLFFYSVGYARLCLSVNL